MYDGGRVSGDVSRRGRRRGEGESRRIDRRSGEGSPGSSMGQKGGAGGDSGRAAEAELGPKILTGSSPRHLAGSLACSLVHWHRLTLDTALDGHRRSVPCVHLTCPRFHLSSLFPVALFLYKIILHHLPARRASPPLIHVTPFPPSYHQPDVSLSNAVRYPISTQTRHRTRSFHKAHSNLCTSTIPVCQATTSEHSH